MKTMIMLVTAFFLLGAMAAAHEEHDFAEAKAIIDAGTTCNQLADEQLEELGDYYMEQMHPGDAHELMDAMHGGEGSASLKQVHINIAKRLYCKENSYVGYSMMGGGMMGNGMMGGTMMGYGTGMMGAGWWPLWQLLYLLIVVGILVLIVLLIVKLWNGLQKKR
ncbi:MAG: hypothetical protein QT02_C0004G0055 [archaeon GW2011_AR9]|nr:MAG: hypothetical protein QT02_C0004G0055 [archaeon GW2011_AR9]MBS3120375.1 hypothetical protein [Candidatus Woesearchaeota archaeon]